MENRLQVVYVDPGGPGYHCLYYMARLAAELLDGELCVMGPYRVTMAKKLGASIPRSRTGPPCLVICPCPTDLSALLTIENWRQRYGRLVAWVFDSFWTKTIPKFLRLSRVFDQLFIAEQEDLDVWQRITAVPVEWLPWGSDVLRLGSSNAVRPIDLLRFGRQPAEWDNDAVTSSQCDRRKVHFHGRPPMLADATQNERSLMDVLGRSKFTLSFSNLVSPNPQTHPYREYLTGRWTDALAAGATVAGVPPRSGSVASLLWPEALLDLGSTKLSDGLHTISEAVNHWSADRAQINYLRSLEYLDWRWRFQQLASALGVRSPRLDAELERVCQTLKATA